MLKMDSLNFTKHKPDYENKQVESAMYF